MHTVWTLANACQEAVADCFRTARIYQNSGHGPPGGGENLRRRYCCHKEQNCPRLLPSVSSEKLFNSYLIPGLTTLATLQLDESRKSKLFGLQKTICDAGPSAENRNAFPHTAWMDGWGLPSIVARNEVHDSAWKLRSVGNSMGGGKPS
jgi:hypothetical protein